jgi:Na+(H+)/acetate symporter ActP
MKTRMQIARFFFFLIVFLVVAIFLLEWPWSANIKDILLDLFYLNIGSGVIAQLTASEYPFKKMNGACFVMLFFCVFFGFLTLPIIAFVAPPKPQT